MSSGTNVVGGGKPRLIDSQGNPWTAAYVDTIGEPTADLRSDIAAEARAKLVYERLIKLNDDPGCKETLNFLMTREIAHQKMFEAALSRIAGDFPPGKLQGDEKLAHLYFNSSSSEQPDEGAGQTVADSPNWTFEYVQDPLAGAAQHSPS